MNKVTVRVPGTTANCGPGFDTVGMACTIYNDLTLELTQSGTIEMTIEGEGAGVIPQDDRNIIVKSVLTVFREVGFDHNGLKLVMRNEVPLARGLGSSAAAIVAGLYAANVVTGSKLNQEELLNLATAIEGHPDNVAPALYGGITVSVMEEGKAHSLRFCPPVELTLVVAVPNFHLSTKSARQVLPKTVSYSDAVYNVSRASLLMSALCTGKLEFLGLALEDRLHQPYRKPLIKGMEQVFEAALSEGALGAAISGSGPCLIAFTQKNAEAIGKKMVQAFTDQSVEARYHVLKLDTEGARVL